MQVLGPSTWLTIVGSVGVLHSCYVTSRMLRLLHAGLPAILDDGRGCLILPIFIFVRDGASTSSIVNQSFTLRSITTLDRPRFFASSLTLLQQPYRLPACPMISIHGNIQQQGCVSWPPDVPCVSARGNRTPHVFHKDGKLSIP